MPSTTFVTPFPVEADRGELENALRVVFNTLEGFGGPWIDTVDPTMETREVEHPHVAEVASALDTLDNSLVVYKRMRDRLAEVLRT